MTDTQRRKWLTLAVVGAAFFMTILDVAIVNVAIPSIQRNLHIAESTVQWVITAYAITSAAFCCSADGWPTCSAAAASFSSGWCCSLWRR